MAGNLVNSEEIRLLDLSLPTGAGAIEIRLRSTAPTESADGTAIGGGNDVQENFAVSAAPGKANLADILFPAAVAAYSVLGYDFYVGAERRWYIALAVPDQRTVQIGDQYKIAAGVLTFGAD